MYSATGTLKGKKKIPWESGSKFLKSNTCHIALHSVDAQTPCRILLQLESEITELILAIFQVKWVSVGLCQWKMHSKISNNRHIKRPLFGKMAFRDLIIYNIFQVHISFSLASFLPTFPKENFQVYRKVERTVQQTLMSPPPRLYSLHSTVFTLSCCLSISLSV